MEERCSEMRGGPSGEYEAEDSTFLGCYEVLLDASWCFMGCYAAFIFLPV
jgi:hypothetical protein